MTVLRQGVIDPLLAKHLYLIEPYGETASLFLWRLQHYQQKAWIPSAVLLKTAKWTPMILVLRQGRQDKSLKIKTYQRKLSIVPIIHYWTNGSLSRC